MSDQSQAPPDEATCKYYVSIDRPECGTKAVALVKLPVRTGAVIVPLCGYHKARVDRNFAQSRIAHKRKDQ